MEIKVMHQKPLKRKGCSTTPETDVKRDTLTAAAQKAVDSVRTRLLSGEVLFYPACGFDWGAIRSLSDRCNLFLYCDWHMTLGDMKHEMSQVSMGNPALNSLQCDWENRVALEACDLTMAPVSASPSILRPGEYGQYRDCHENFANKTPWCRLVPAIHTVNGQQRMLDLIFLCAEGVAAYLQVFNAQRIAPRYLCINNCGAGFGFNWTDFRFYDMPLGRAVRDNPSTPEFLIHGDGATVDWPWNVAVEKLENFGEMYVRANVPMATDGSGPGHRLTVTKRKRPSKLPEKPQKVASDDMDLNALLDYMDECQERTGRKVLEILNHLDAHRVLFYPGGGADWSPIPLMRPFCDLFIYCGWTERDLDCSIFGKGDGSLFSVDHPHSEDLRDFVRQHASLEHLPWRDPESESTDLAVFGHTSELKKLSDKDEREVLFVQIASDPITLYRNLFVAQQTAPFVLCLKRPDRAPADAWRGFHASYGPLAEVIKEGSRVPEWVISDFNTQFSRP